MSYIVYMHENKVNGKKYIGMTSRPLKQRSNGGEGYKGCTKFYNAIQKYGWDNFRHIILYKNLTKEEAEFREQQLIKSHNTQTKGYNIANGGCVNAITEETKEKISKSHSQNHNKVFLTLPNGKIIIFDNLDEASKKTRLDKKYIRGCCEGTIPTSKIDFSFGEKY